MGKAIIKLIKAPIKAYWRVAVKDIASSHCFYSLNSYRYSTPMDPIDQFRAGMQISDGFNIFFKYLIRKNMF